jgi:hypothetical protein
LFQLLGEQANARSIYPFTAVPKHLAPRNTRHPDNDPNVFDNDSRDKPLKGADKVTAARNGIAAIR